MGPGLRGGLCAVVAGAVLTIQLWRPLTAGERDAVTAEAESLPLPGLRRGLAVHWDT